MASLKQLATQLIDATNQPFNIPLYERAKDLLVHERALEYRRSVQKNGIDDEFKQRFKIAVQLVDKADLYGVETYSKVYRSVNTIPKPIRFMNDAPFTYIGSVDWSYPYSYSSAFTIDALDSLRYMSQVPKYIFSNGYLYFLFKGNPSLENVGVEGIFADPRELDYSNSNTAPVPYEDDMEFPISEDLISSIKIRIFKGDLTLTITDDQEITITDENEHR